RRDLQAYFPAYPLGTELTVEEQSLAAALQWLKAETATPANRVGTALAALLSGGDGSQKKALARMALDKGMGPKQVFLRRLVGYALKKTAVKKSPLR
ncbi:MAG: acetyl-CoA hydrolase, partial [Gammaproteobacteria bacterium]|nr:acetyl-CoA hydrolase [Gammaproteobacteria bacterium]